MKSEKLPLSGSVFLVPLRSDGYCVGVLAKTSGKGQAFGYFFGPKVCETSEVDTKALVAEEAILVGMFGDLELIRGNWPVVGAITPWNPSQWPMLPLARVDEVAKRAWLSTYGEDFQCLDEKEIAVSEANNYPYDRMMGAGSVEIRLTRLVEESLASQSKSKESKDQSRLTSDR